jgi:hypothetical protein
MPGPINNSLTTQIEPVEPVITFALGIPIVTVNVALSAVHIPSNLQTFVGPGLAQNMLCPGTVSLGDQMGLGVASGISSGPDTPIAGNPQCLIGPAPITSLATPHLQDLSNGSGMSAIPGQFSVISAV